MCDNYIIYRLLFVLDRLLEIFLHYSIPQTSSLGVKGGFDVPRLGHP